MKKMKDMIFLEKHLVNGGCFTTQELYGTLKKTENLTGEHFGSVDVPVEQRERLLVIL